LKSELVRLNPPEISVGTVLPSMRGTNLKGEEVTVNYGRDNRKTILIVFAPDCPVCNESGNSWKRLIKAVDENKFRVVAVSLVTLTSMI
jgi:peroxiredoxin